MRQAVYWRAVILRMRSMAYFPAAADNAASGRTKRIGVLLVNLGTPDSPTYFAVQRYLRDFLGDRRVIDTPRAIWMQEGSPLAVYSRRLAAKIEAALSERHGDAVRTRLAMTYGNPSIESAVKEFARD